MVDLNYLAYLEEMLTENRKERFLNVLQHRTNHFTIAVEDIFQFHNTSAVMRSCEVFGIQELNIVEQRFGKNIDKEIAMGAQKWVDINKYETINNCIDSLKEKGYQIIATTPHNDSCLLHEFDVTKKSAFFFGTEKEGLSAKSITDIVKLNFDCRPGALARDLVLREPKYNVTAAYCHFGREPFEKNGMKFFAWENPVDLTKYASMTTTDVDSEIEAKKEEVLTKWVD